MLTSACISDNFSPLDLDMINCLVFQNMYKWLMGNYFSVAWTRDNILVLLTAIQFSIIIFYPKKILISKWLLTINTENHLWCVRLSNLSSIHSQNKRKRKQKGFTGRNRALKSDSAKLITEYCIRDWITLTGLLLTRQNVYCILLSSDLFETSSYIFISFSSAA